MAARREDEEEGDQVDDNHIRVSPPSLGHAPLRIVRLLLVHSFAVLLPPSRTKSTDKYPPIS